MLPEDRIPQQDEALLRRMLEAAQAASLFSQGMTRASLENHLMFYYAVAKAVELIGEAANYVSAVSRSELSEIDWDDMVGMRHRLVHSFHGIDKDKVWDTMVNDVPALTPQLQVVLEQHGG